MYFDKHISTYGKFFLKPTLLVLLSSLFLASCGSDDDDDGFIRFYNVSENSPDLFLTIDENLDLDDEDDFERTFSGLGFTELSGEISIDTDDYFYEIAFQIDEDTDDRDDLEIVAEGSLSVRDDEIQLIVADSDLNALNVTVHTIPVIDTDELEDDFEDELFNLRVLNTHPTATPTLFIGPEDGTFAGATALENGTVNFGELSENLKISEDRYEFYVANTADNTAEGAVAEFSSDTIELRNSGQFIMIIRENTINDGSPFILELASRGTSIEIADFNAVTSFRGYNAIRVSDELNEEINAVYDGNLEFDFVDLNSTRDTPIFNSGIIAQNEFSDTSIQENGTFSLTASIPGTDDIIINNAIVSLEENDDVTAFLFVTEENRDRDGDDDFDENNDGVVDDVEAFVDVLEVDNSTSVSAVNTDLTLLNFIDSDEFEINEFDEVRIRFINNNSGDSFDDATQNVVVPYATPITVTLLNNTYTVIVSALVGRTTQSITSFELILDETSVPQFIIVEGDANDLGSIAPTTFDQ